MTDLPTASAMETDHVADAFDRIAGDLRRTADRLAQKAASLRAGPRTTAINVDVPVSWAMHDALHDIITMIANMSLPQAVRTAAQADVYRAQEHAGPDGG